ncbi:MAG: DUF58 domain-containing protein [Phycisphaeraceae bacterium]
MDERLRQAAFEGQRAAARLALADPRRVTRGVVGAKLGRDVGSSLEFMDHRVYHPGDDVRRIDWSAYARSDRLHVKTFRDEVCPHLELLIDTSASMALEETAKADATVAMAGALVTAAENSRFTWEVSLAGERGCQPLAQGSGRPEAWHGLSFAGDFSVDAALQQMRPRWRSGSLRMLISDLLFAGDPLATLRPMAESAAGLVVIQILAKADMGVGERGSVRVVDSESGQTLDVAVDAGVEQRYTQLLARHQQMWQEAAAGLGAVLVPLVAEDLLADWELESLVHAHVLKAA